MGTQKTAAGQNTADVLSAAGDPHDLFPVAQVSFTGNWDVLGLRGAGSIGKPAIVTMLR